MQGFIQTSSFSIASPSPLNPPDSEARQGGNQDEAESVDVDYIILSRRSRQRAGLRYQRRGIDEDANVANFVETETITRIEVCFLGLETSYLIARLKVFRCFPFFTPVGGSTQRL